MTQLSGWLLEAVVVVFIVIELNHKFAFQWFKNDDDDYIPITKERKEMWAKRH